MRYTNMGELILMRQTQGHPSPAEWKTWVLEEPTIIAGYTVPENFCTDFASIPWFARWAFRSNGAPWQRAAVVHDFLYSSTSTSRAHADRTYYWVARQDGTSELRAAAMYAALRVGAGPAYRKNQRRFIQDPEWRILKGEGGSPLWNGVSG